VRNDERPLIRGLKTVVPAQAGTQGLRPRPRKLGSRLRGNDTLGELVIAHYCALPHKIRSLSHIGGARRPGSVQWHHRNDC